MYIINCTNMKISLFFYPHRIWSVGVFTFFILFEIRDTSLKKILADHVTRSLIISERT